MATKQASRKVVSGRKRGLPKGNNVGVRFDPEMRAELDKAASETQRSLSNLIRLATVEWLERNGYMKK
jgi:hypothetical protein